MAFDPNYSDIWLLLRFNGSDGATSFPDASMFPKTATAYGSVQIDSAYSAYGGASALFNGSTDYLKYGDTADCMFLHDGTVFTLEFQAKVTHTGGTQVVMDSTAASSAGITIFRNAGSGQLIFYMRNDAGTNVLDGGNLGVMMDDGVFHHYRFTFDPELESDQLKLWIDGEFSAASDLTGEPGTGVAGNPLHIGVNYGLTQFFTGHLDDVRITKGVVRNTEDFTVEESGDLADSEASAGITMPMPTVKLLAGFGLHAVFPLSRVEVVMRTGALIRSEMPMPQAFAATGSRLLVTMPMPAVFAAARTGATEFLRATMPMPTVQMRTGARIGAVMPMPQAGGVIEVVHLARAEITMPMPVMVANAMSFSVARAGLKMPFPTVVARGPARILAVLPMPKIGGTIARGSMGSIAAGMPMPVVVARAVSITGAILHAVMPMPRTSNPSRLHAVMPMPAVVAYAQHALEVTYEAYSINLEMADKVGLVYPATHYTNFPFDRIVRWGNDYYGVARTGLYRLGGATDYATPEPLAVAYDWKTHSTDNDVPERKTVSEVYLAGRIGATANLRLYAGDEEPREYAYAVNREAVARNYRQKFGKGIKARYVALGMDGDEELELDTVEPEIINLSRRL